jgi:hypothetical protein
MNAISDYSDSSEKFKSSEGNVVLIKDERRKDSRLLHAGRLVLLQG